MSGPLSDTKERRIMEEAKEQSIQTEAAEEAVTESPIQNHQTSISLVNAIPAAIDAGAELLLRLKAFCACGCSLAGGTIHIYDHQGVLAAEAVLPGIAEGEDKPSECAVMAPAVPGDYTWTAVLQEQQSEDILHAQCTASFLLHVRPHQISVSVWGLPLPAIKGKAFKGKIGAKCSAGCSLAGLPFIIEDEHQNQIAACQFGEEILPQTKATYWAEVELPALDDESVHEWVARCMTPESTLPHEIENASFTFRTVAAPEYTVCIEVTDDYEHKPVAGANVALGWYRAITDAQGIANIEAPAGEQSLSVIKNDYLTSQTTVKITEDTIIKIELNYYPVL